MLKGIPVSDGYAIAKCYHWIDQQVDTSKIVVQHPEKEILFFHDILNQTVQQLDTLIHQSKELFGEETSKIFEAHKLMALDPELNEAVIKRIKNESCNMIYALKTESDSYVKIFENLDDPYLKERSLDLIDVTKRMLRNALSIQVDDMVLPKEPIILVASELTPSQIAAIDSNYVKGIITETGGKTSHTAIIAKLIGIPMIMGVDDVFKLTTHQNMMIMDAFQGEIITSYTHETYQYYMGKRDGYDHYKQSLKALVMQPSTTLDQKNYLLSGQIGSSKDSEQIIMNGAKGVGLFRTEFLFINRLDAPSEEEQYLEYKKVLEQFYPETVTIRTIDLGGDKMTPYLKTLNELNPSLGIRAIRLSIYHQKIIYEQLRALLRASSHGNLKIMFPMISTIEELLQAKEWINDIKHEFDSLHISYGSFDIGMMIEVPSAALMANEFAKHVDFFSIGTNDLIQYTFAADRTHQDLDYLYRPFSPAIIKLIYMTVEAAKKQNKWVSVCGEMASDMLAVPLLLGLGIDELSMSSNVILKAKDFIRKSNQSMFEKVANDIITCSTEKEIIKRLKEAYPTL